MEDRGKFIFILGGARSGKSSVAEKITRNLGENVLYVATAAVLDQEMEKRVEIHRRRRPDYWSTIEETNRVSDVIEDNGSDFQVIMIDCLTLLVSNLLLDDNYYPDGSDMEFSSKEMAILAEIEKLSKVAKKAKAHVVMVSNDLGSGIVPTNALARTYRDIIGWANQTAAKYADEVYFTVAGLPVELKELSKKVTDKYNF